MIGTEVDKMDYTKTLLDQMDEVIERLSFLTVRIYTVEKFLQAQINDLDEDLQRLEEELEDELTDLELRLRSLEKKVKKCE